MAPQQSLERLAVLENHPLKPYTTFKIGGPARFFARLEARQEVPQVLELAGRAQSAQTESLPHFVLGGGSNVLVSDAGLQAFVIHPANRGISVVREDPDEVWLAVEAGETWDDLVAFAAARNWWGIENLSHIPGQTGAALVQNAGAYGQQISDVLANAEIADLSTGAAKLLSKEQCRLAYRRSIFNTTHKCLYLILSVTLRLSKRPQPNLVYPDVKNWFERKGDSRPSIQEIRHAIISIRDNKFPFPREEVGGNAGSFFKNVIINRNAYPQLERQFQQEFGTPELRRLRELVGQFSSGETVKIPTAFLMEICGLKQCRVGGVQVNESQPLVLLNRGGATAREAMTLARKVRQTIFARTRLAVAIEPELVGFSYGELQEYLALPEGMEGSEPPA